MPSQTPYRIAMTAQEFEALLAQIPSKIDSSIIRTTLANADQTTIPTTKAVQDALDVISGDFSSLGDLAFTDDIDLASTQVKGVTPITKGGTGANSAAGARANLGILTQTEIENLISEAIPTIQAVDLSSSQAVGVLPISKGGTGAQTATVARGNLGVLSSSETRSLLLTQSVILTDAGRVKINAATVSTPVIITRIGVSDSLGAITSSRTSLQNEVWRGDVNPDSREVSNKDEAKIFSGDVPTTTASFIVREVAYFDQDGLMIAIGQTQPIEKPTTSLLCLKSFLVLDSVLQASKVVTKAVMGSLDDLDGFTKELLAQSGVVDSGVPDSEGNSQRVRAMQKIFSNVGTVVDIAVGKFPVGAYVRLTDRSMRLFLVESGNTPNGYDKLDAGNGNTAVLVQEDVTNFNAYGNSNSALQASEDRNVSGSVLQIGAGLYAGNYTVANSAISGEGSSTILTATSGNVLTINRRLPDWDYRKFSNFTLDGGGKQANGVTYGDNPVSGRVALDNIWITETNIGTFKSTGNIGDSYNLVSYSVGNYGHRALSNPSMHSGASVHDKCHWEVMDLACYYVNDSLDGCGQWVVRDSIMEACGGFGVLMNLHNLTPYTPPVFDNLWTENVATTPTVSIDGAVRKPYAFSFENTPFARIKDSYVYSLELKNSRVHGDGLRIDDAYMGIVDHSIDTSSLLVVDNLYANGNIGSGPFVRSIANQATEAKLCSVRGPLKVAQIPIANMSNVTEVICNSFSGAGPWLFVGTTSRNAISVSDGVLNSTCAEILVNPSDILQYGYNIPSNFQFLVWGCHAKVVSGSNDDVTMYISDGINVGEVFTRRNEWVCSYGIKSVPLGSGTVRFKILNTGSAAATVRIADLFVVTFATAEEAYEFVNSGYAIKNEL